MSPRSPNLIYRELVEAPDDFIGLVAYGIYKRRKIEFIQGVVTQTGDAPSDQQIETFHLSCKANIPGYRTEATAVIQSFLEQYSIDEIDNYKRKLEDEFSNRQDILQAEFENKLERIKPSAFANIFQGAIGSFVFTIAVGLIVVFILGFRIGLGGLVEEFLKTLGPMKLPPTIP
ncbi:hypothetical protein [Humidesulfovibrio sp.]